MFKLVDLFKGDQLHVAAESGDLDTFQSLLGQENTIITKNNQGYNPLDIAIEKGHKNIAECISCHQRCWEFLHDGTSVSGMTQLQMMAERMPRVAEKFLDRCVEQKCDSKTNDDVQTKYSFVLLYGMSKDPTECFNKLSNTLKVMVHQRDEGCLSHPVCVAYLKDFWLRIGFWLFFVNFIFYLIFLACLTSLALLLEHRSKDLKELIRSLRWVVIFLSLLQLIKEIIQIPSQKWCYFTRADSWFEISLYSISIVSILQYGRHEDNRLTPEVLRSLMALTVFLAFTNILLYMRSSFVFGTYIVIMFSIIKTLLQIIVLLLPFVCAYGIPFYIIFSIPENPDDPQNVVSSDKCANTTTHSTSFHLFDTVTLSIWTTFMLLLGEMKYPHTLYKYQPISNYYPVITYGIYVTMVLCMPIIVKNLLIGLSVGDIKRIVDLSRRTHLLSQVERLIDIEARLPSFIRQRLFVDHVVEYPFRKKSLTIKFMSTGFPTITPIDDQSAKENKENDLHHMGNAIKTLTARINEQDEKVSEILRILKDIQNSRNADTKKLQIWV